MNPARLSSRREASLLRQAGRFQPVQGQGAEGEDRQQRARRPGFVLAGQGLAAPVAHRPHLGDARGGRWTA